jgi:hypothetical protein
MNGLLVLGALLLAAWKGHEALAGDVTSGVVAVLAVALAVVTFVRIVVEHRLRGGR